MRMDTQLTLTSSDMRKSFDIPRCLEGCIKQLVLIQVKRHHTANSRSAGDVDQLIGNYVNRLRNIVAMLAGGNGETQADTDAVSLTSQNLYDLDYIPICTEMLMQNMLLLVLRLRLS